MTQAELAKASGVSQSAIANYENGARKSSKNIFSLAKALMVNPFWLAEGISPMENLLSEPTPDYMSLDTGVWPFRTISLDVWQSLTADQQRIVEQTVSTLIQSLLNTPNRR